MTAFLMIVSILEMFVACAHCLNGDMTKAIYIVGLAIFNVLVAIVADR